MKQCERLPTVGNAGIIKNIFIKTRGFGITGMLHLRVFLCAEGGIHGNIRLLQGKLEGAKRSAANGRAGGVTYPAKPHICGQTIGQGLQTPVVVSFG
jgi:hypothetical protein